MAMKPLPTSRSRDATSPAEPAGSGGRAVTSSKGVESPAQKDQGAQQGGGHAQRRPREQRELDEQRRALAKLVLGVFEVQADPEPAPAGDAAAQRSGAPAPRPTLDPRLEQAILEFMYALFDALDQIDDAEPTLAFGVAGAPASAAPNGRSAFGERIDLLAGRIAALAPASAQAGGAAALNLSAGLELAYLGVLRVFNADAAAPAEPGLLRQALAALLRRLANAMHVAPTLGYGTSGNAGALLRVRA